MYTAHLQFSKFICSIVLLSLGAIVLSSCGRHSESPLDPQEILARKLGNPNQEIGTAESISLIEYCAQLGDENAASATNQEVVLVLGNTGVGKSTFLNYLIGCEMKAAVDECEEEIIVVAPESIRPAVMSIGHGGQSQTFMPQIVQTPDESNSAYCDCSGFYDTRGAEINIANAINIRKVLQQATGVKAIFLTSYNGLSAGRGSSIRNLEAMCHQIFGGIDNLRKHQDAVLLGITKAPRYTTSGQPLSINSIRLRLNRANSDIAAIIADRIFLFDPLDRGSNNPDFWSIEKCRSEIAQLSSIPQLEATTLFQTVLTDGDQTELKLKHIMRAQASALAASLECDDYQAAGRHWQLLTRLSVIGHDEVFKSMLGCL